MYSFLNQESYDAILSEAAELGMEVTGHVPMALSVEYVLERGQKAIAHSEELAKHAGKYDAARVEYFAERMATSGAWLIPMLVTTRSFQDLFDDPEGVYARPEAEHFRHPMRLGARGERRFPSHRARRLARNSVAVRWSSERPAPHHRRARRPHVLDDDSALLLPPPRGRDRSRHPSHAGHHHRSRRSKC